jgi:lipopolysaccharide transport system ATP-binding protein
MTDIAIRVDNLSKLYHLGARQQRPDTLRDALTGAFARRRRNGPTPTDHRSPITDPGSPDDLWALKDVSFEVKRGEVVGIIGRNGAGKSTLLKILSRITEPTSGVAEIHGRVGSLLEVGTGFHPELTGRENIFLNGAILGMRRVEIQRSFDEIVAFAEIERFLDTPVKRYSSGMYVRLAFAVAAHLEPEILLVDEVLAVGDAAFQKKCLGKMGDVAQEGRTVLFVSHNLPATMSLCQSGLMLDHGRIGSSGYIHKVVSDYRAGFGRSQQGNLRQQISLLPIDQDFELLDVVISQNGAFSEQFQSHLPIDIDIRYRVKRMTEGIRVGMDLFQEDGTHVFRSYDDDSPQNLGCRTGSNTYVSRVRIPGNILNTGIFLIDIIAGIHNIRWFLKDSVDWMFEIVQTAGPNLHYVGVRPGVLLPDLAWEITPLVTKGLKS